MGTAVQILALGRRLLRLLALCLDLPPAWFLDRFLKPIAILRPLHYSPRLSRPEEVCSMQSRLCPVPTLCASLVYLTTEMCTGYHESYRLHVCSNSLSDRLKREDFRDVLAIPLTVMCWRQGIYGCGAHTDYGVLTLLATDGSPGLQIRCGACHRAASLLRRAVPLQSLLMRVCTSALSTAHPPHLSRGRLPAAHVL